MKVISVLGSPTKDGNTCLLEREVLKEKLYESDGIILSSSLWLIRGTPF